MLDSVELGEHTERVRIASPLPIGAGTGAALCNTTSLSSAGMTLEEEAVARAIALSLAETRMNTSAFATAPVVFSHYNGLHPPGTCGAIDALADVPQLRTDSPSGWCPSRHGC